MKLTCGIGTAKDIAMCCLTSAKMLEIADCPLADETKRKNIQELNCKQAALLRKCAAMLMGKDE